MHNVLAPDRELARRYIWLTRGSSPCECSGWDYLKEIQAKEGFSFFDRDFILWPWKRSPQGGPGWWNKPSAHPRPHHIHENTSHQSLHPEQTGPQRCLGRGPGPCCPAHGRQVLLMEREPFQAQEPWAELSAQTAAGHTVSHRFAQAAPVFTEASLWNSLYNMEETGLLCSALSLGSPAPGGSPTARPLRTHAPVGRGPSGWWPVLSGSCLVPLLLVLLSCGSYPVQVGGGSTDPARRNPGLPSWGQLCHHQQCFAPLEKWQHWSFKAHILIRKRCWV